MWDFCSEELKSKLGPTRKQLKDIEERNAMKAIAKKKAEKAEQGSTTSTTTTTTTTSSDKMELDKKPGE